MNAESDEPELTLDRALLLLNFDKWLELNKMCEVIEQGLKSRKPIDSHKKLGSRIGMEPWDFNRFRKKVVKALGEFLPNRGDLITKPVPLLTEGGERAWEMADWVIRTARAERFQKNS